MFYFGLLRKWNKKANNDKTFQRPFIKDNQCEPVPDKHSFAHSASSLILQYYTWLFKQIAIKDHERLTAIPFDTAAKSSSKVIISVCDCE